MKIIGKFRFGFSAAHWGDELKVQHGPQVWSWWRLFSLSVVRLGVQLPSTGYRLWLYTRWGALYAECFIDRRKPA